MRVASTLFALISTLAFAADELATDPSLLENRLTRRLERERDLQRAQDELTRLLQEERQRRFTDKRDSIGEALVTLPTRQFQPAVTARDRLSEVGIQNALTRLSSRRFEELQTKPDSNDPAPTMREDSPPPPVTNFATLKVSLDRLGDPHLTKPGILGGLADQARSKAEAKRNEDKTEPRDESPEVPHPETTGTDPATRRPSARTLNDLTAEQFLTSAKAAEDYFKFARDKIRPLADRETEVDQLTQADQRTPPPEPPGGEGGGKPPGGQDGGKGSQPKQDGNKNQAKNAQPSPQPDDSKKDDEKGNQPGGNAPKYEPVNAKFEPANVPTPGTIPTMNIPPQPGGNEVNLATLSELTKLLPPPGREPASFDVGRTLSPNLALIPATPPKMEKAAVPVVRDNLISGERSPGNALPAYNSSSGGGTTAAAESSSPPIRSAAVSPSSLDGSVPKAGGGEFPAGGPGPRVYQAGTGPSGGFADDGDDVGTLATGFTQPAKPQMGGELRMNDPKVSPHGILSHVGHWCRRVERGAVAACSR